jgi:hypothetical protein
VLDANSLATLADVTLPGEPAGSDISISSDGRYVYLARGRSGGASGLAVLDTTTNTIVHERPTPNARATAVRDPLSSWDRTRSNRRHRT